MKKLIIVREKPKKKTLKLARMYKNLEKQLI